MIKSSKLTEGQILYRRLTNRRRLIVCIVFLFTVILFITDLSTGPMHYSLIKILSDFWYGDISIPNYVIMIDIRLPMALSALVVGASLSIAGVEMQTVLDNPLASPFTLGLSAAASFGAALGLIMGISILPESVIAFAIPINAFLVSMVAALFIYHLSRKRGISTEIIVLLGTSLVFTFSSLLELLQYVAPDQVLSAVVFWTMGSLSRVSWFKLSIMSFVLVIVSFLFVRRAWALTALRLGETRAIALGIPVARLRLQVILLSSLLASICISFVGTIGFIGLVAPHIARMMVGEDQRFLLPTSALCGASMLSAASFLSKSLISGQNLPIGIVTSLVGVPLFFFLILRTRQR